MAGVVEPLAPAGASAGTRSQASASGRARHLDPERFIVPALLAVAVAVRLWHFTGDHPLWYDEAAVAVHILDRSWSELLTPTEFGQTAPAGFWLVQKALVSLLGASEWVFRLLPLIVGLATLAVFHALARRLLDPRGAHLALAMFALSPFVAWYCAQAKPYIIDVLAAVALPLVALRFRDVPTPRRGWEIGATAAALVWFSQPAVFVLAGVGLALLLRFGRDPRSSRILAGPAILAGASAAAAVAVSFRMVTPEGMAYMHEFWRSGFLPFPPLSMSALEAYFDRAIWVFKYPGGIHALDIGPVLFLGGVVLLWPSRRFALALLLLPVVVTLAAAMAGRYPFGGTEYGIGGRVILFTVPAMLLPIAATLAGLTRSRRTLLRPAGWLLAAVVLALNVMVGHLTRMDYGEDMRPVAAHIAAGWRDGDRGYVDQPALPAFRYYAPRYGIDPSLWHQGEYFGAEPDGFAAEVAAHRGQPRVWIVTREMVEFVHAAQYREMLDRFGTSLDSVRAGMVRGYLYDMRRDGPS